MASSRLSSFAALVLIAGLGMACGLLGLDEEEAGPIPVPAPAPEPVKRTPNPGFDCAKARSWSSKTVEMILVLRVGMTMLFGTTV